MILYAISNVMHGYNASLGLESLDYQGSGALVLGILYFIIHKQWSQLNDPADALLDPDKRPRKVMFRTWDNRFDWHGVLVCVIGAICSLGVFFSIILSFKMCQQAGLNIGIGQAIWATNSFMTSLMERVVFGKTFDLSQLYGMTLLVICAGLICLSDVFQPPENSQLIVATGDTPIWLAVLSSFVMPVMLSVFYCIIKYNNEKFRGHPKDFTMNYQTLTSTIQVVTGVTHWTTRGGFQLDHFIYGFFSGSFVMGGAIFGISAMAVSPSYGPTAALINS